MVTGRVLEFNLSFVGPGPAGNQIEKSTFAGSIWANDRAQLAFIQVKVQIIDRLEAIEAFRHALSGKDKSFAHGNAGVVLVLVVVLVLACCRTERWSVGVPEYWLVWSRRFGLELIVDDLF